MDFYILQNNDSIFNYMDFYILQNNDSFRNCPN